MEYIHRSEKNAENPYAQISRKMAQDSSLTFQARGLMLYILSKPPKWKGKAPDLMREGHIKAKALKTILDELIAKRYIVRHEEHNKKGRFEYFLEVFEEPELNQITTTAEECLTVPPSRGVGTDTPLRLPRKVGSAIDSTGAPAFSSTERREKKDSVVAPKRQPKPRRTDLFDVPPAMCLLTFAADKDWLKLNAPNIPDPKVATEQWNRKQVTNAVDGKGKTIEQWRASWEGYMVTFSLNHKNGFNDHSKSDYRGPSREVVDPVAEEKRLNCRRCNTTGTESFTQMVDGKSRRFARPCNHEALETVTA